MANCAFSPSLTDGSTADMLNVGNVETGTFNGTDMEPVPTVYLMFGCAMLAVIETSLAREVAEFVFIVPTVTLSPALIINGFGASSAAKVEPSVSPILIVNGRSRLGAGSAMITNSNAPPATTLS